MSGDDCAARRQEWQEQTEHAMSLRPGNFRREAILKEVADARRAHPECAE